MSTIKLGWGTRVGLLYLGFVALIVTLVYKSMQQDFDLVSTDYYNEELKYQDVIDASRNQATLSSPVVISQRAEEVVMQFPTEFRQANITGTAQFYSKIDADWDKKFEIRIIDGICRIPTTTLAATTYQIKLKWWLDEKPYYQETEIKIVR
jgi:tRNA/tmRNA/rRNA uracil-C5-methylase (TrmA/RlmC/RlmD family)